MESLDRVDRLDGPSSRALTERPAAAGGAQSPLQLQLQATAGNRAVAQLVAGAGPLALQVQRARRQRPTTTSAPKPLKGDKLQFSGVVQEALPRAMFRVRADNGMVVLASISEGIRQYFVKIEAGDRVAVEVSPYDPSRGTITRREG